MCEYQPIPLLQQPRQRRSPQKHFKVAVKNSFFFFSFHWGIFKMLIMTFWDFHLILVSQRGFPHICVHIFSQTDDKPFLVKL